ncbi:MAG: DNA-binding protein WhiA [Porcipelethomonas sp.]
MASFSNDVKEELCSGITDRDKMYACLYGAVLYCRNVTENHISFNTESPGFASLLEMLFIRVFGNSVQLIREESIRKNNILMYTLSVSSSETVKKIYDEYCINIDHREINLRNIVNNSLNSFLAGAFFVCGSISDPYKEYHLEFVVPDKLLADNLHSLLMNLGLEAGKTERKNNFVLYIKDSENIEDFLTFIGARQSTIDLMNIKIYKDVRNKANRIANCDAANIDKVVSASQKQIDDINVIKLGGYFDSLSPVLKETAALRLENPEYSLSEIGELMEKPIGRSGVVKRFQRIAVIADEIRKNG